MPTGPEMLRTVKAATADSPCNTEYWLEIHDMLDLCKLTAEDLVASGYDEAAANKIEAALNDQNVGPLGDLLGIQLIVKFRVFASRDHEKCKLRCQGDNNSMWMKTYLSTTFPESSLSEPEQIEDTPLFRFDVMFDANATPYSVREALLACPAALLLRLYEVRVNERPHFRIEAYNLATWLETQMEEPWWTVDGDPVLMSRLEFPSPPDELANALRQVEGTILAADPLGNADGAELLPGEVSQAVDTDEWGNRLMTLSWESGSSDWQLIEDEPTSEGITE